LFTFHWKIHRSIVLFLFFFMSRRTKLFLLESYNSQFNLHQACSHVYFYAVPVNIFYIFVKTSSVCSVVQPFDDQQMGLMRLMFWDIKSIYNPILWSCQCAYIYSSVNVYTFTVKFLQSNTCIIQNPDQNVISQHFFVQKNLSNLTPPYSVIQHKIWFPRRGNTLFLTFIIWRE